MAAAPVVPKKHRTSSVPHGPARRAALENLSMLLSAGVDVASAISAATKSTVAAPVRRRLDAAATAVQGGVPLWKALVDEGLLATHQAWLVRVGEESGGLAEHMTTAVEYERREELFHRRLTSALLYPVLVLCIAVVVGVGVAWFILPRLVTVFGSLRVALPLSTRILLAVGKFLSHNGFWAVPLFVLLAALAIYALFFAERTKATGQTLLLWLPGFGKLIREIEIARFGDILGSLLHAGVPIPQALGALADASSFHPYPLLYRHLHLRVTDGQTISEALAAWPKSSRYLPATIHEILGVAEQTGQMAAATAQIGEAYELRLDTTAKNLVALIEPLALFLVWLGVVGLAVAVITPLYSVLQGVNR